MLVKYHQNKKTRIKQHYLNSAVNQQKFFFFQMSVGHIQQFQVAQQLHEGGTCGFRSFDVRRMTTQLQRLHFHSINICRQLHWVRQLKQTIIIDFDEIELKIPEQLYHVRHTQSLLVFEQMPFLKKNIKQTQQELESYIWSICNSKYLLFN